MEDIACSNCQKMGEVCMHCWRCKDCCTCETFVGKKESKKILNGSKKARA